MRVIGIAVFIVFAVRAEAPRDLNNRGIELYREGRYGEAEKSFRAALEGWDAGGAKHDRALTLTNLAVLYRSTGRFDDAEQLLRESLRDLEALDGPESVSV